jgi:hypothetical protein
MGWICKNMLKTGIINNCEKCGASYGQYDEKKENNFSEYWCMFPVVINSTLNEDNTITLIKQPAKGLCQFCNPESKYYNQ